MPNYEMCNKLCPNFKARGSKYLPDQVEKLFCNVSGRYLGESGWSGISEELDVYCLSPAAKPPELIGQPEPKKPADRVSNSSSGHSFSGGSSHG